MLSCSVVSILCDPMDCCPPGSSVRGIFRVRIWRWLPCPTPGMSFPIQRSNPHLLCLPHGQADSLPLYHLENPYLGEFERKEQLAVVLHFSLPWVCKALSCTSLVIVVPLLSHVWLFGTPWTVAHQAYLSFTISQSLLKLMSIMSVMPSNLLILFCPLLVLLSVFPSIRVFSVSQLFASFGQSIAASASVLPMIIQGSFPLGVTGLISLLSKTLKSLF